MKRGQITEGIVEELRYPDRGRLHADDGTLLEVKNVLPGQRVRVKVTKAGRDPVRAQLCEILAKSPLETEEDPCRHFGRCGGCAYSTIPYEEELRLKEKQIRVLLSPYFFGPGWPDASDGAVWEGIIPSPSRDCTRNKMEYTFGNERLDGPLALGLHVRGSFYDILDTEDCRIVDGDFRMLRNAVREYFAGKGVPFYHRSRKDGILRYLIVRKARFSGESLTVLVTAPGYVPEPDFVPMLRALPLSGRLAGIWHGITDSVADTAYCSDVRLLDGKEYITEHLLGLSFRITPYSFFQTNSAGAEVLYSRVREYAGSARCRRIYDLYCGTGTITQLLAGSADEVIGVEIVGEAVEAAKRNAVENGLDNCRFLCGDVLKTLDSLESDADLVILDPPREGVHAKALAKIAGDFAPERIVYVSCKATSLVRDLELLTAYGYRPVRGCCVDMFPRTGHVETVVLLSRGSDGEHSRVYVHPSGLE